jgi:peptidoglycan-associated lipoprotein
MIKRITKFLLSLALGALLSACASHPTKPSVQPGPAAASAPAAAGAQAGAAPQAGLAANPLNNPNSILSKRSVYFDFDKSDIKPQFKPLIEAHAKYLIAHPGAHITIQGNTDERGSTEYNVALGQRRADAVMNLMKDLGVPGSQMEAISFGKEKPRALGHDEAAWAQNRRDDIVYDKEQ